MINKILNHPFIQKVSSFPLSSFKHFLFQKFILFTDFLGRKFPWIFIHKDELLDAFSVSTLMLILIKFLYSVFFSQYPGFIFNILFLIFSTGINFKFLSLEKIKGFIMDKIFSNPSIIAPVTFINGNGATPEEIIESQIFPELDKTYFNKSLKNRFFEKFICGLILIRLFLLSEPYTFILGRFLIIYFLIFNQYYFVVAFVGIIVSLSRIIYHITYWTVKDFNHRIASYARTDDFKLVDELMQKYTPDKGSIEEYLGTAMECTEEEEFDRNFIKNPEQIADSGIIIKPTWDNAVIMYYIILNPLIINVDLEDPYLSGNISRKKIDWKSYLRGYKYYLSQVDYSTYYGYLSNLPVGIGAFKTNFPGIPSKLEIQPEKNIYIYYFINLLIYYGLSKGNFEATEVMWSCTFVCYKILKTQPANLTSFYFEGPKNGFIPDPKWDIIVKQAQKKGNFHELFSHPGTYMHDPSTDNIYVMPLLSHKINKMSLMYYPSVYSWNQNLNPSGNKYWGISHILYGFSRNSPCYAETQLHFQNNSTNFQDQTCANLIKMGKRKFLNVINYDKIQSLKSDEYFVGVTTNYSPNIKLPEPLLNTFYCLLDEYSDKMEAKKKMEEILENISNNPYADTKLKKYSKNFLKILKEYDAKFMQSHFNTTPLQNIPEVNVSEIQVTKEDLLDKNTPVKKNSLLVSEYLGVNPGEHLLEARGSSLAFANFDSGKKLKITDGNSNLTTELTKTELQTDISKWKPATPTSKGPQRNCIISSQRTSQQTNMQRAINHQNNKEVNINVPGTTKKIPNSSNSNINTPE